MSNAEDYTLSAKPTTLIPGYNVDSIDLGPELAMATQTGYTSPEHRMVVEYTLSRWAKGEEALPEETALAEGIYFNSWRMILAAATAGGAP